MSLARPLARIGAWVIANPKKVLGYAKLLWSAGWTSERAAEFVGLLPEDFPRPFGWTDKQIYEAVKKAIREGNKFSRKYTGDLDEGHGMRVGPYTPKRTRDTGYLPRGAAESWQAYSKKQRLDEEDNAQFSPRNLAPEFEMAVLGGGAAGQHKRSRMKRGKPLRKGRLTAALAKTGVADAIVRYQSVRAYGAGATSGTYNDLAHYQSLNGSGARVNLSETLYPVQCIDLTCVNMDARAMGSTIPPIETMRINPRWYLGSNTTGNFVWTQYGDFAQDTTAAEGLDQARWFTEVAKTQNDANQVVIGTASSLGGRDRMCLKWSDIRIQALGARAYPIKFHAMIVKFKDSDFDPYNNGITYAGSTSATGLSTFTSVATGVLNAEKRAEFDSVCKAWLKPKVFNPLDVQHSDGRKLFKVLASKSFTFRPDTSTNLDTNRAAADLKIFYRHGSVIDFRWENALNETAPNIDPQLGEMDTAHVQTYFNSVASRHPYAKPGQRIWLLLVADDWIKKTAQADNIGLTPGYPAAGGPSIYLNQPFSSGASTNSNTSGYNVIIRNKWLYDRTN